MDWSNAEWIPLDYVSKDPARPMKIRMWRSRKDDPKSKIRATLFFSNEMLKRMRDGGVKDDVSIDIGGDNLNLIRLSPGSKKNPAQRFKITEFKGGARILLGIVKHWPHEEKEAEGTVDQDKKQSDIFYFALPNDWAKAAPLAKRVEPAPAPATPPAPAGGLGMTKPPANAAQSRLQTFGAKRS